MTTGIPDSYPEYKGKVRAPAAADAASPGFRPSDGDSFAGSTASPLQSHGAGHTPGPWGRELRAFPPRMFIIRVGAGSDEPAIAEVANAANARLIAAAPELLEFAERIATNAKTMAEDREQSASSRRWWEICEQDARAAIAKARGQ